MNNNGLFLILLIIGLGVVLFAFNFFMRKLLKVESKKWFSYNHINDLHKKIDWGIRITFTIIFLVSTYYTIYMEPTKNVWYFEVWFVFVIFFLISESVRAFMEWKYVTNRNAYILTIFEMVFIIVLLISLVKTNFFIY